MEVSQNLKFRPGVSSADLRRKPENQRDGSHPFELAEECPHNMAFTL
jgi:hypothetical protein